MLVRIFDHHSVYEISAVMSTLRDFFKSDFENPKPYKGFKNLSRGVYKIFKFKMVKNKFIKDGGDSSKFSVMVELENQVLFLPQHLAKKF